ncbi:BA14K family protein [Rhizobium sp. WL3]|uniref:BA14K family protein n=1 Tax=Rhizobium sp. WL3 TaxID=2603277 RepID=UPI0011C20BFB|nr:BA14K family protein [Rhizobium sp. WL3]QEE45305.1 BA14K family protein [Rhizobium sp. WL3]
MKPVLELLAASALSVGMVIGGVVVASAAFSPEEEQHQFTGLDIGDLWTSEPVRIDRTEQNLERLPPRYASHVVMTEPKAAEMVATLETEKSDSASRVGGIDLGATGSVTDDLADMGLAALPPEHVTWCATRYRSYDPVDNTYRGFSGELRDCASPHQVNPAADMDQGEGSLVTVSNDQNEIDSNVSGMQNIRACRERYRSYRVEDNSYQPYGGGPRRQCQILSF